MDRSRKVMALLIVVAAMVTACGAHDDQQPPPATEPVLPTVGTAIPSSEPTLNPTVGPDNSAGIPVTGDLNPARLSNLLHFEIVNQSGQQIGEVQDMIMDLDASAITYVVVNTGGILNVGARQIAVPWNMLQLQANTDATSQGFFMLLTDEHFFMDAPTIQLEQDLPKIGQPAQDWDQKFRSYWNVVPTPTSTPSISPPAGTDQSPTPEGVPLKGILLASVALGFNFKLQGEQDLNVSIDDVIVNIQSGKILYVVIHTNFENARDQWVPIPYSLLELDLPDRTYILNVDMVTLQSAPFYIDSLYPNTTHRGWDDSYVYFWKQHGLTARP